MTDPPFDPSELPGPVDLLRAWGRPARKRFGQNFLTDPGVLDRIVRAAGVRPEERVLEIGPGPGGLTTRLLAAGADVVAIEADPDLAAHLPTVFPAGAPLHVLAGDALGPVLDEGLEEPARTVVANLPYNVATEILFRLVQRDDPPPRMALMFQREVATRIVSRGAERTFGLLAIGTQIRYRVELAMTLKPGAFTPAPKVHSAVVRFERRPDPLCDPTIEDAVRRVARMAFGARRKMLRRSLLGLDQDPIPLLDAAGIPPTARPEALDLDAFVRLGRVVHERTTAAGATSGG